MAAGDASATAPPLQPDLALSPTLDASALARLPLELLPILVEETVQLVAGIRTAIERRDAAGLKRAAHTLKGNSSYLGAVRLTALSTELEQHGREGALEGVGTLLTQVEQEFAQVRQALEEL